MAPEKPVKGTHSKQEVDAATDLLWKGILTRRPHLIIQSLLSGADSSRGPEKEMLTQYKDHQLTQETLPLTALLLSSHRWSDFNDRLFMDYKNACRALTIHTRKKQHFGARDAMTPLLAYAKMDPTKKRHALCEMIVRKTPKEALDFQDEKGHSCLFYLIDQQRVEDVKTVVRAGADLAHCDHKGRNALHWDCMAREKHSHKKQQNRAIMQFLLDQKTPMVVDQDGQHPLMLDCEIPLSHPGVVDINALDGRGRSLALLALQSFQWDRWRQLLDDGRTDWLKQIPDLDAFIKQRHQRSFSNDKQAAAMYEQIVLLRQHLELQHETPLSNAPPRLRF